jgi:small-conductance mechanosensitive channel
MLDQLTALASKYRELAVDYMGSGIVLIQLGLIIVLLLPALLLARKLRPPLEERAERIKDLPGTKRVIGTILDRLDSLFFVILLGIAYVITTALSWPESNYLVYIVMLLTGAWLVISIVVQGIRSPLLRRLFGYFGWIYVAAAILGIVDDTAAMLDSVGVDFGEGRISILSVLKTAVLLALALWVSRSLGLYLDRRIQNISELTPSLRVLFGKVTRIALVILAASVALSGLGIDLTALTVLSGALGVGLGFGLQKVVSNFISGPGDTISLGDTFGWIRELRSRFVSVVTRDGREFLIPNEDFITQRVINWSFSDKYVRLDVEFGVSYDSDPHEVSRIAIESTSAVDRVDTTRKPPVCWMTEFGDSSLNFKLRFWITDPQGGLTNIRGKVLLALWDALKENNVEIPYPHRELVMKTPLPVTAIEE